ncbi:MAG: phosphoribosylformylglycinamidine cyclo-ligase [Gammaproteobacteria bacterium]|nr:phosphoribosylformylglycinamidine cyclo-ligase [Gammaproteobacteria bacterium]
MNASRRPPITYRDAGVDIERGERLVERIKELAAATRREGMLGGIGGFGALFELAPGRWRHPVLVSGTDGVGTKLRLAIDHDRHDTIGIDLVAMCANDVVVQGAEPLFFLDYFATGRLDEAVAVRVMAGICRGCELAGAALIGGETAEMPGMYADHDYDLAGFCVGVVERDDIIDGAGVRPGDRLLGLASSGPHANGYSLVRKLLAATGADLTAPMDGADGATLLDRLMAPTRIYVKSVLALRARVPVKALAHVTGGGITENLPRVLPAGTAARVDRAAWPRAAVFDWLQKASGVDDAEFLRTFNAGVGMIACVAPEHEANARAALEQAGEQVFPIGEVIASPDAEPAVVYA